METSAQTLKKTPPQWLESLVEKITPAPWREEFLGDLAAWYVNTPQYILYAGFWLPHYILRQIRRCHNRSLIAAETCVLTVAFVQASSFLQMLIILIVSLGAFALCDAYGHPSNGSAKEAAIDAVVVGVVLVLSQALLRWTGSALSVPLDLLARGTAVGLLMISAFRMMFRSTPDGPQLVPEQPPEVMRRVNILWIIAAMIDLRVNEMMLPEFAPHQDFFLTMVPMLIFGSAYRMQNPDAFGLAKIKIRPSGDPRRADLVRKRDALWNSKAFAGIEILALAILGFPLFLGALTAGATWLRIIVNFAAFLGLSALWIAIRKANYRAAQALHKQIDEIDDKEKKSRQ